MNYTIGCISICANNIGVSMQTDATPPTVSLYRAGTRRRDTNTDSDVSYAWSTIHGDLA